MKRILLSIILMVFCLPLIIGQTSATYNAGNIPTSFDDSGAPLHDHDPTCTGLVTTLVVNIPAGDLVTGVDVTYDFEAVGGGWISDQQSQIYCQDTGQDEGGYVSQGVNTGGLQNYTRTGLTLANGVDADGVLTFEMRAFRTWGGTLCDELYNFIPDGTWTVTVYHTAAPSCLPISNLAASNVTSDGADISWTAGGTETMWNLEYGSVGYTQGTGTTVSGVTNPYSLTGLMAQTSYDVYVQADCGGSGTSSWVGPVNFATLCAPTVVTSMMPYCEDFNVDPVACWSQNGAAPWEIDAVNGHAIASFWDFNAPNTMVFTTHAITFDAGMTAPQVVFDWSHLYNATYPDDALDVSISTDGGMTWTSLIYMTGDPGLNSNDGAGSTSPGAFVTQTIDLTAYVGQTVMFQFTGVSDFGPDLFLDYICFQEAPTCTPIMADFTVVPDCVNNNFSIDVNITDLGGATMVDISDGTSNLATGVGAGVTNVGPFTNNVPVNLTVVHPNSNLCNADSTGLINTCPPPSPVGVTCVTGSPLVVFSDELDAVGGWTGDIGTLNDQWDLPTATPGGNSGDTGPSAQHSGTSHAEFEASGINTNTASLISPAIDLTGGADQAELTFWMHAYGAAIGTLNVGVSTSATGPFTTLWTWTGQYQTADTDPWAQVGLDLTAYLGQTIYVEFMYGADGTAWTGDLALDLVEVTTCVSCTQPTATFTVVPDCANLQFSVDVDISSLGDAATVDISDGVTTLASGVGTGVTTVGPFADGSVVDLTVVHDANATCNVIETGLTNQCPPPSPVGVTCATGSPLVVFSDELDAVGGWTGDIGTLDGQWDLPTASPGGNSGSTGPSAQHSGTSHAEFEASAINTNTASLISPAIDLTGGADQAELTFWMHAYGAAIGTLNVGVSTSATGPFTTLWTWTGQYQTADTDPWNQVGLDLTAYLGQTVYIEFLYGADGTDWTGDLALDLVEVTTCVSCTQPTATFTVVPDCVNSQFSVDVDITSLGDAATVDITDGVTTLASGIGTGVTTVGPFADGSVVDLTVVHDANATCNISQIGLTNQCPPPSPMGVNCISGGTATLLFSDDMETATGWTGDLGTGAGQWDFPTASPGGNSFDTGPDGPASGTTYAEFEATSATTAPASMISPAIDLSTAVDAAELTFFMHAYGAFIGTLNVGVSTSPTGPFTTLWTWSGPYQAIETDPWNQVGIDLSSYIGQTIYVEFLYNLDVANYQGDLAIDLVEVTSCSSGVTCDAPTNLDATNITGNSAHLTWDAGGTETNWDVEYGMSGFTPGTGTMLEGVPTDSVNLNDLMPGIDYEYYVCANCNALTSDLIITGAIDGPLPGGQPKAVELYAINDVSDLSTYGMGVANNGGGTDGQEYYFPAGTLTAGQFYYVVFDTSGTSFTNFFGFAPDDSNGDFGLRFNGDDAIELYNFGAVVDIFGDVDVSGSGQTWDYLDGWAYRMNGTGPDGLAFNQANWMYSGPNAMDGEIDNATATTPFPLGTFVPAAPPAVVQSCAGPFLFTTPCDAMGGTIATTDPTTICAGDGVADLINISLTGEMGPNSQWVITDDMGVILDLPAGPPFDLEGAGSGVCVIWHLSYYDGLTGAVVGNNATTDLVGCYNLSNGITVTREGVAGGTIATTDPTTICAGDGVADPINVTLTGDEGDNSQWVITDDMGVILDLPAGPPFDLEGAGSGVCVIWHLSYYDGLTGAVVGNNATTDLVGCYNLSNGIIVTREGVAGGTIATTDPTTICASDGNPDPIDVTLSGNEGDSTQWVITDDMGVILDLPAGPPFDLDGAPAGTCLIWHLGYNTGLTGLAVGNNATTDIAGCYSLSNPITVVREEAFGGTIATTDPTTICAGDGVADPIDVTITGNAGDSTQWVITDDLGNILDLPMAPPFDLEGAGGGTCLIWSISFSYGLTGLDVGNNATTDLMGCYGLSNPITVVREPVNGGMISTTDPTTICIDGVGDPIDVTLTGNEGDNSQWVITDDMGVILDLPAGPPFDLDGAGAGTCIIWHLSYNDGLTGAVVGNNATTDLMGCYSLSNPITVVRTEVVVTLDMVNDVTCGGAMNGGVMITASGGIEPYSYMWSDINMSTNEDLLGVSGGSYMVTVTDATGCTSEAGPFVVNENAPMEVTMADLTDSSCKNADDGSIDLTPGGGDGNYTFLWSNGEMTEDIFGLEPNDYFVTITDGMGCQLIGGPYTVNEPSTLIVTVDNVTDSNFGANNGSIDISTTGGTQPYSYMWSPNGETTEDLSGLAPGNYTVTVTDAGGCQLVVGSILVDELVYTTDIESLTAFNVYPNPAANYLNIELAFTDSKDINIEMLNALGQVLMIQNHNNITESMFELNTSDLPAGVYFVRIHAPADNTQAIQRLIIQR